MKKAYFLLIIFALLISSCEAQKNVLFLNYKAQTRGFNLAINLNEKILEISNNGSLSTKTLTEEQFLRIAQKVNEIDFTSIKNNLNTEETAVDKAIPAFLEIKTQNETYKFNFNHTNLPKKIAELLEVLTELEN